MSSVIVFFFKQKTAYEMRISDWSSDVCSSDLASDNSMTMNGVSTMPSRFDAAAATTAPATLPRAMEVKAIDDWTVEGSAARNSMPAQSGWATKPGISI